MTTWKSIPLYPKYEASEDGEIRNARTGKVLKPFNDPLQEYDRITVYEGGHKIKVMVHFLVAWTFLGPAPEGKKEIDHLNTNIHDNRACNLSWVSRSQNCANPVSKFNREVARIRRAILSGKKSQEDILRLVKIMKAAI